MILVAETEPKILTEYDEMKLYMGDRFYQYWPTPKIRIYQPSVLDIIDYGDVKFYSSVTTLCANPTSLRIQLWDIGIDWNKITEFELFKMLIKNYTPDETRLLFGDLNLSWFDEYHNNETDSDVLVYNPRNEKGERIPIDLYDVDNLTCITESDYQKIVGFLRYVFNIHPKVEKAKGKTTKLTIIEDEKLRLANEAKLNKDNSSKASFLLPLVSSCLNHPGFKYKKSELGEVGIIEFMDSVRRLQTYESSTALMKGIYSGMVDTSKIKDVNNEINWMKNLSA